MAAFANDARGKRRAGISEHDDNFEVSRWRKANRDGWGPRRAKERPQVETAGRKRLGPTRAARMGTEEFKCRHCRAFVGPMVTGGRHRNHCPLCLHSRHVDDSRPGDRASDCRSSMAPIARFDRPGGEPVIVHRCLGCRLERHNRLAADDNLALLIRLPLVAPRLGRAPERGMATSDGSDTPGVRSVRRSVRREVS